LRYWTHLILAVASALGVAVFSLLTPRLLGAAVDQAQGLAGGHARPGAMNSLAVVAGLILAAAALRGLSQGALGFEGEYLGQKVANDLRLEYFEKLQRLSFSYHDKNHSGDLITRGMIDLDAIRAFVETALLRTVNLALLVAVGIYMLLSADPIMGLLAMSFFPFVAFRAGRTGALLRVSWTKLQQLQSVLTRTMEENLQGIRVVRAFSAESFELGKFDEVADKALALSNRRLTIRTSSGVINTSVFYLSMALVLWVGGGRVSRGQLTIGQLAEFLTYMGIFLMPLRQVGMVINSTARAISSGARLFSVLDSVPALQDSPGAKRLQVTEGRLKFDQVSFEYEPGKPVLTDISFEVGPGKTLGIVGHPGSGKSTIAHLVPRFYDVTSGTITIDGQDVRDVTLESLRASVGLIQQDSFLFDCSVNNNVAYAEPYAEEELIVDAATTAQIHDHVVGLPAGYGTRVGERGVALSGGQRQRMSIARGVMPNSQILIFDDATAAIDAVTEQQVRAALRTVTQRKATIIIAHRLSSLLHADEILVLDEGRVVERGAHAQLLAAGRQYAELYQLQTHVAPMAPALTPDLQL
jgi:ATP-binding cassette subfamily B protein